MRSRGRIREASDPPSLVPVRGAALAALLRVTSVAFTLDPHSHAIPAMAEQAPEQIAALPTLATCRRA